MMRAMVDNLLERLSRRLRLPYGVLALAVSVVLFLPLDPISPPGESHLLKNITRPGLGAWTDEVDLAFKVILVALFFYCLVAIRWMRERSARTLVEIADLAPDGEGAGNGPFARAADGRPPLVASLILLVVLLAEHFASGGTVPADWMPVFVLDVAVMAVRAIVIVSFVWVYMGSVAGLTAICRRPLRFVSNLDDPFLGTRPLGDLSLALASAYFIGMAVAAAWLYSAGAQPTLSATWAACTCLGLVLFFFPLRAVHRQMTAKKAELSALSTARLLEILDLSMRVTPAHRSTVELTDLHAAVAWGYVDGRVAAIRTWPFDTVLIARLVSAFAVPILIAVIAHVAILETMGG